MDQTDSDSNESTTVLFILFITVNGNIGENHWKIKTFFQSGYNLTWIVSLGDLATTIFFSKPISFL